MIINSNMLIPFIQAIEDIDNICVKHIMSSVLRLSL